MPLIVPDAGEREHDGHVLGRFGGAEMEVPSRPPRRRETRGNAPAPTAIASDNPIGPQTE